MQRSRLGSWRMAPSIRAFRLQVSVQPFPGVKRRESYSRHQHDAERPASSSADHSRFGTSINGAQIGVGNTAAVHPNDLLAFGHKTKYRWGSLACCRHVAAHICAHTDDIGIQRQAYGTNTVCLVAFGRATWDRVMLCAPEAATDCMQPAAALGFHCRRQWDGGCTHLMLQGPQAGLSAALACARAAGRSIMHKKWCGCADAARPVAH